jgi:peptidoglycan LD-endopeptidase CwlK
MINSRSLDDLLTPVKVMALKFLGLCALEKIDVLVTSTYRDYESQNELYAQGRTKPGKKVTNARGGDSFHNHRVAFDVVPLRNGKPVWGTTGDDLKLWQRLGTLGKQCGLEWAGDWKKFKEFPHFQYTNGLTIEDFKRNH